MGIPPADLRHITPYEFNLLREGYFESKEADYLDRWEQTREIAYTVYASICQAVGGKPDAKEDFIPLKIDAERAKRNAEAPKARKIDSNLKASLEAKMNAI